jgi:hypothetical protein
MHVALIDVGEWQTVVDLRDGRPVEVAHPRLDVAAAVCSAHPYPGDLTPEGLRWVTDTALDLNSRYAPDWFFLNYAHAYLHALFRPQAEGEQAAQVGAVFGEIERFLDATGFEPVVVGLGELMPWLGTIETTDLDALVLAAGMNSRIAGLFDPSPRDLETMAHRMGVERIVSREAFRAEFGGSEGFYAACPDYLVVAQAGYIFRGVNVGCRPLHRVPRPEDNLPLYTLLPGGEALTDVPDLVLQGLANRKVALILVEGVGCASFPWPFRRISNRLHWLCYTMGADQYLALTSGRHFVDYPYPPGYRYELYDTPGAAYPLSGIFRDMPEQTIGRRFAKRSAARSAAVGSRSMLTHVAAGADITVECFARALYNHGVMAAIEIPSQID